MTLRPATVEEIEAHLLSLGGGNHEGNMAQVRGAQRHYLVSLTEDEFLDLVFLKNGTVAAICGEDRRLRAVAAAAAGLGRTVLGPNWDLGSLRDRAVTLVQHVPALLLRDVRSGEEKHGRYYLQDGSHRALAYAMAVRDGSTYRPVRAYLATNSRSA